MAQHVTNTYHWQPAHTGRRAGGCVPWNTLTTSARTRRACGFCRTEQTLVCQRCTLTRANQQGSVTPCKTTYAKSYRHGGVW